MSTQDKITTEQKGLIAELAATYGIEPEEVIFFAGDPRPIFSYEATAVLCNKLTDLRGIDIEPVNNGFVDSVSYRCTLTRSDGVTRSAVGVANVAERDAAGTTLASSQLVELASGRAIRNALRVAGIDLLKLHNQRSSGVVEFSGSSRSDRELKLRQAHKLGIEAGLIKGYDKTAWYAVLDHRYEVSGSHQLPDDLLADFVAFLTSLASQTRQKAA